MNNLSEKTASISYGKIKTTHNASNLTASEKVPKIGQILEHIFKEMTANDVISTANLFARMSHLYTAHSNVPRHIVDITHQTRKICNDIRHNSLIPNDKDYVACVESVALCINFFSGVAIPQEIECIYNPNVLPPVKIDTPLPPKPRPTPPILTIRQKDLIDNPMARLPVALLLDVSGSMLTDDRIGELNEGIKLFFNSILNDEVTKYSIELSIITFGRIVTKMLDFANIERQIDDFQKNMPLSVKSVYDGTPMGEAVELAINLLSDRKSEYKTAGVEYYQPWLVLMTDGQPTDSIVNATALTSKMVESGKLSLFPIAIGVGANLTELAKFSTKRVPLQLRGLNFKEFFEWLKESAKSTSQSTPGQNINLPPPGWAIL